MNTKSTSLRTLGVATAMAILMAASPSILANDRFETEIEADTSRESISERAPELDSTRINVEGGALQGSSSPGTNSVGSTAAGAANKAAERAQSQLNSYKVTTNAEISNLKNQLASAGGSDYTFSQSTTDDGWCSYGGNKYTKYLNVYKDGALQDQIILDKKMECESDPDAGMNSGI